MQDIPTSILAAIKDANMSLKELIKRLFRADRPIILYIIAVLFFCMPICRKILKLDYSAIILVLSTLCIVGIVLFYRNRN